MLAPKSLKSSLFRNGKNMHYVGGKQVSFLVTPKRNVHPPTNSPLDSAWDAARELFALTDTSSPDAEAVVAAQKKVTNLLLEQLGNECKISGFGHEMTISCNSPKPPVRELLLLVAVNACSPGTIDFALELVKAMASNEHLLKHPEEWQSEEGREAVRALHKAGWQLETEKNAAGPVAYLKKALPESASAIVTLIECAKLSGELNAEYVQAFNCIDGAIDSAVDEAEKLLEKGDKFEANKLLDSLAGLTPAPTRLADGQFAKTMAEQLVRKAFRSNSQMLLETLYQRDRQAYIKIAVAEGMHMIAVGYERARNDLTVLKENVARLMKVCAKDWIFLELVKKSQIYIEIYSELTGSELSPD